MKWLVLFLVVLFAIMGALLYYMNEEHKKWEDWCSDQGGLVTSATSTSQTHSVSSNGQYVPGTSVSTMYFCLTIDGRVLGVK